jgi:hypothetical protein
VAAARAICGASRLVSAPGEKLRTHPICGVRPRPLFSAATAEAEAASAAARRSMAIAVSLKSDGVAAHELIF